MPGPLAAHFCMCHQVLFLNVFNQNPHYTFVYGVFVGKLVGRLGAATLKLCNRTVKYYSGLSVKCSYLQGIEVVRFGTWNVYSAQIGNCHVKLLLLFFHCL